MCACSGIEASFVKLSKSFWENSVCSQICFVYECINVYIHKRRWNSIRTENIFLLIFMNNDYGDREEDSSSHCLYFLLLGNLVFDSRFVL